MRVGGQVIVAAVVLTVMGCGRQRFDRTGDSDPAGRACTQDADCGGTRCVDGVCEGNGGDSTCTAHSQCFNGSCVAGICIPHGGDVGLVLCESDAGCSPEEFCLFRRLSSDTSGVCTPDCTDVDDCPTFQRCHRGRCYTNDPCGVTTDCHPGEVCVAGLGLCGPPEDTEVDWCRIDEPARLTAATTQAFEVHGLLYEAGITDRTPNTDADANVIAMAGHGPRGSSPVDNADWIWSAASPQPGWVDTDMPGRDRHVSTVIAPPSVGNFDLAFRFSVDRGTRWTYCDRDAGLEGQDGSEDGYQPANAVELVTVVSPCSPNPCTSPDPPSCDADGDTLITYTAPGLCEPDGLQIQCTYPRQESACSTIGATCEDGACVGGAGRPDTPGTIVITELMARSQAGTDPGEWVELYNPGPDGYALGGCILGDADSDAHVIGGIIFIGAGETALLAKSGDPTENHGLPIVDYIYGGFDLSNSADEIIIACDGIEIDRVEYDSGDIPTGASLSLDPGVYDAINNDDISNFCPGSRVYGNANMLGSPGYANPPCPPPDTSIDTCKVMLPASTSAVTGLPFHFAVRMFNAGLTDRTDQIDPHPDLIAQAGYGAGGDPLSGSWTWFAATANAAWNAAPTPDDGYDEYLADIDAPAVGLWTVAFRFSLDAGDSWVVCDRDALDGLYDPAWKAELVTVPDPCLGDPCPAISACLDAVTTVIAPAGTCSLNGAEAECSYTYQNFDCGLVNGTCSGGQCVGGFRPPLPGEVVITELMHTPPSTVDPLKGQWVELRSLTFDELILLGCTLGTEAGPTSIGGVVLPPLGSAIFAGAATSNGGLAPHGILSHPLDPNGDMISLACGGADIDAVTYDAAVSFPGAVRVAMQLDPSLLNGTDNDDGASWCLSRVTAPMGAHYGTPAVPNLPCKDVADACRLVWSSDLVDVEQGTPVQVRGVVEDLGLTDRTSSADAHPAIRVEVGRGPTGTDPALAGGWAWFAAVADSSWIAPGDPDPDARADGYVASFPAPAPGAWDLAYRVTLDGGRQWTMCDADGGTYEASAAGHLATVPSTTSNLYFSEYLEGGLNNKALEIYNAGGSPVALSSCEVRIYFNGTSTAATTIPLPTTDLAAGDTFVLCYNGISSNGSCDMLSTANFFNGNDAVSLACGGDVLDVIGRVGQDPGVNGWEGGTTSTLNQTLRRKCTVTIGDRQSNDAFDPASEWDSLPQDTFGGLGDRGC